MDAEYVSAELREIDEYDLENAETVWSISRSEIVTQLKRKEVDRSEWPQSSSWSWHEKRIDFSLLSISGFGVYLEGGCQGLMAFNRDSDVSLLDPGKPLIHIDWLEVAPWNWKIPALRSVGFYAGVGSLLLAQAVRVSFDEGFKGRVHLMALPQAEEFYTRCGMTKTSSLPPQFEFTEVAAVKFIEGRI